MKYTPEEIAEVIAASNNPIYFAGKILKSYATGQAEVMTKKQVEWLTSYANHVDMGDERQSRRTSTMLARALWQATYKQNQSIMYVAHRHASAQDARRTLNIMLESLPEHLKHEVKYNNQRQIEFVNGSVIYFEALTPSTGRGRSINLLFLDNMSHVRPEIYHEAVMEILYPCLMACRAQIFESK